MMRKRILAVAIASVLSANTLAPVAVQASGFPVVDLASIAESVKAYAQDLLNYEEYMQQTAEAVKTAKQTYDLYQQALVSYDHMLRQMQELKNRIDRKDWEGVYTRYAAIIEMSPGQPVIDGTWKEANEKVDSVFYRGNDLDTLEKEINSIGFSANERDRLLAEIGRTRAKTNLATIQQLAVDEFNEQAKDNIADLAELDETRSKLGPEDHLATLQLMTDQNAKALEIQQQQLVQSNTAMQLSNQLASHVFSREQKAEEVNLKNLKDKVTNTYVIDETPLGGF